MSDVRCAACGASNSPSQRFCGACGARISQSDSETMTSPLPKAPAAAATPPRIATDARFLPGQVIADRYRMIGLLGRGGMGEVYRADDLKLGQPVALKFLPRDVEADATHLDRFLNEVKLSLKVTHPHVCRVYDIGEIAGRHFLSMEYVDGEDLASLLRRIGRLPEDKAVEIARQLCADLQAAHDEGVLHRDLKPSNVMIDGRGRAKITDFGLAGATAGIAGRDAMAGTPQYMAPEQFDGRELSVQTDLYALGLILCELFTGKRVFESRDLNELAQLRSSTPSTLATHVSGLNPIVERAILHCLNPDPSKRPRSAKALADALPGGDPLAMALAAGETPSPEIVAAAGGEGTLPSKVGVPLIVAFVILVVIAAFFNERRLYTATVPFPYSAEVLSTKAREMLERLGYPASAGAALVGKPETPADSGYGFLRSTTYTQWVERRDTSRGRWQGLASVRPRPARFWYRTSP